MLKICEYFHRLILEMFLLRCKIIFIGLKLIHLHLI